MRVHADNDYARVFHVLTSGLFGMNKYYGAGIANPRRGSAPFVGSHHFYAA
jgi:hypothetical protein